MDKIEVAGIHLRTESTPDAPSGQAIIVSVMLPDGREVDVINEWGALSDITISHHVSAGGIEHRSRK